MVETTHADKHESALNHWRYRVEAPLGSGGMGTVYRAYDRLTRTYVALKQVGEQANSLADPTAGSSRSTRVLLANEFQMLASLRHPHIISVLDYGFGTDQRPFFTMMLLDDAQTLTEAAQILPQAQQAQLGLQTLQALEYLHARNILHRDLKPDNALAVNNNVYVLDFGLSSLKSQEIEDDFISGTLAYMAPEVLQQEAATERSDLYAMGVMLHEMFAGKHPFDLNNSNIGVIISQILFENPDTSALGAEMGVFLDTLLAKDPEDRHPDARTVIQRLCAALDLPLPEETYAIREGYLQSAPFTGRADEMTLLKDALSRTSDAQSEFWLIGGEVGVGKTRLLHELRTRALVNGTLILHGQSVNEGRLPYQLLREPLRRLVLMQEVGDLDASILKDIVPDISELLERPISDAATVDAKTHHQRLVETISRLLRGVAQPLLILLEDMQWAAESLDVLQHLAEDINNIESLLIVGSFRSDESPELPQQFANVQVHILERLDYEAISALSASILGDQAVRSDLVQFLHRQSEGNVYFLVETIRALAKEAGQLRRVAQMPIPKQLMAGGINEVMLRRWRAAPANAQHLLRYAALASREIDLDLLANIADAPDIERWLTDCTNVYILERVNETWQFTHERLRTAIVETIEPVQKPVLFRHLALAMEQIYPDQPEHASTLARFWQFAQDVPKELHYRRVSGAFLLRLSALIAATTQFERALTILAQADLPTAAQQPLRADLLRQLGECLRYRSQYAEAKAHLEAALTLYKELDDVAMIARTELELCDNAMLQGQYDEAIAWAEACINNDQAETKTRALMQLGVARIHQGEREAAVALLEEALALSEAAGDKTLKADVEINLGVVAFHTGQLEKAQAYFVDTLAIKKEIGERRRVAILLNNLGSVMGMQGELEQSRAFFTEAFEIATEIGERRSIKLSIDNLGVIAMMTEDYPLANRYLEQSLGLSLEMGDQPGYINTLINIGHVARAEEHVSRAIKFYQQAIHAAQSINAQPLLLEALAGAASAVDDNEVAAAWLSALRGQAAITNETQEIITTAWQRVEQVLSAEALAHSQTVGAGLTLDDLAKAVSTYTASDAAE